MKTVLSSVAAMAIAIGIGGCHKGATMTPPTTGPGGPSAMVVSLDAVEVATAAAAPWFPGAAGAWLAQVTPTAQSIAADLQLADPFARAQAYIGTFQQILASAPAQASLSGNQVKAMQSAVAAIQAFLLIYEQQSGAGAAVAIQAHQITHWSPNAADRKLLKALSR